MKPRPLKMRLANIVLLLSLVPMVSTLLIYFYTRSAYQKSIERFSENIVAEKIQALDSYYQDINLILQQMVDQSAMMEFLTADESTGEYNLQASQSNIAAQIDSILSIKQRQISAVYVIPVDKSRQIVFKRSVNYLMEPVYRYRDYDIEERTLEKPMVQWAFDWEAPSPFLAASLRVYSAQRDMALATMILRLHNGYFNELLGCSTNRDILLQLADGNDHVIYSYAIDRDGRSNGKEIDAANFYKCSMRSAVSGWQLTCYIPYTQLDQKLKWIPWFLMLEIPVLIAMVFLSVRLLRQWVYRPVRQLTEAMRNFTISESVSLPVEDELKEMSIGFEAMRARIVSLIEDVRNEDQKRSQMELQMLQMQIMPHFLLNTLNTIKSLLALGNVSQAAAMLQAFMEMLHMSLSDVRSLISLNEEIHYLQQYVVIMSIRRNASIQVVLNVDDDCQSCTVPKYILQPLAENSILHGFSQMEEQTPVITLTARRQGGDLLLILEDNGSGISAEQIELFNQRKKGQFSSIGLPNVHARIQLLFGEPYGLNIQSEGGSTQVILHLPFQ